MKKILFILDSIYGWERTGLMIISSVLKENGHKVSLYNICGQNVEQIIYNVRQIKPDIIAYQAMTIEIDRLLAINSEIRKNVPVNVLSIFGGPHPTFSPEMIEQPFVDAICRGEAEGPIIKYMQYLNGKLHANQVDNFWIKEDHKIIKNDISPWAADLDSIPFPDRAIWDDVDPDPSQKVIFVSRGCPYKCTYCFNHIYNKIYEYPHPLIRHRSVDNVIEEMKQVRKKYPTISFFIGDDSLLMASVDWLEEFKSKYIKEIGIPFACNIRANQVTEEKIRILAEAGCNHCWFGLECGDEQFSNKILKRNLKNHQIIRAADLLRKHNIPFITQNLTALPADNPLKIDLKTIDLNIMCKPDYAMAHIFFPFPKTELGKYTIEKGLYNQEIKLDSKICHLSPLKFTTKMKRKLERQRALMGHIVAYPILRHILPLLRILPLDKLYLKLHLHYAAYCMAVVRRPDNKGVRDEPYAYLSILLKTILLFCKNKARQLKGMGKLFHNDD